MIPIPPKKPKKHKDDLDDLIDKILHPPLGHIYSIYSCEMITVRERIPLFRRLLYRILGFVYTEYSESLRIDYIKQLLTEYIDKTKSN